VVVEVVVEVVVDESEVVEATPPSQTLSKLSQKVAKVRATVAVSKLKLVNHSKFRSLT
jgi:hypothetical protein